MRERLDVGLVAYNSREVECSDTKYGCLWLKTRARECERRPLAVAAGCWQQGEMLSRLEVLVVLIIMVTSTT